MRLTLTVEVRPFAGLDETGPVERMAAIWTRQHGKLRLPQRVATSEAILQPAVIGSHDFPRDVVTDWPKAHDQGFGAGKEERAPETINSFAIFYFADARVTGGERYELRAPQGQPRGFHCGEDAVIVRPFVQVRAGERETGSKERVLDPGARVDRSRPAAGNASFTGGFGRPIVEEETMGRDVQHTRGLHVRKRRLGCLLPSQHSGIGKKRFD